METQSFGALAGYRVLDLAQGSCLMCGKILADLGADVIKVEPPRGDPTRYVGPFYKDVPHPERSLFWFAYNTNKRSITLDIETTDGKDMFKRLTKSADFIIESFEPGYLDALELGYLSLSEINPRVILVSITPFGQTGPYAQYKSTDLICWAMGGALYISGDPDQPPNWISFPQAFLHAGAEAATASLISHWYRETTGEGQHIDVSVQQSVLWATMNITAYWDLSKRNVTRKGSSFTFLNASVQETFPCKDGFVTFLPRGGALSGAIRSVQALVSWMAEENMAPEWLKNLDWVNDFEATRVTQEMADRLEKSISEFTMTKTKAELYARAIKEGMLLAPVNTAKDIAQDGQLISREYWMSVDHPELGDRLTYCGPFVKLSETPINIRLRPPLIGEHNEEIYVDEFGLSRDDLVVLREIGAI